MKRIRVVQIGYGTVGGTLLEQIVRNRSRWRERLGLDFMVVAVGGRRGAVASDVDNGIPDEAMLDLVRQRREGADPATRLTPWDAVIHQAAAHAHAVVIDAAAGADTATYDAMALDQGAAVVLSNKAPLALPMSDPRSRMLWREARSNGRLRYETTVGAGLPVISSLQTLLDTGDTVLEMQGMLSGTFGAIFSDVSAGTPFSKAVRVAKGAGYTEPDPRDDLSGLDVARKALILARTAGHDVDLSGIDIRSFVPDDLGGVSVDAFLGGIERMNDEIGNLASDAVADGGSLKYVATVGADGQIAVGLRTVPGTTVLGALNGPENVVSFRTVRYHDYPMVVSGPGAGAEVTAAGMAGDLLRVATVLR